MAYYIGLMSGTSMDALDAVLVDIHDDDLYPPKVLACYSIPLPADHIALLEELCVSGVDEICRMSIVDDAHARLSSDAVNSLLDIAGVFPSQVSAIGSHGQTIRHLPNEPHHLSLQIGNPSLIAELTGITTVADFRRRDIAAGGQGAPLVPAFHAAVFRSGDINRIIVNIGGMANITVLPSDHSLPVTGFDTGPGNVLMDAWITLCQGVNYDGQGQWAASGLVIDALLFQLLNEPYFSMSPPKSTGRELFNIRWLRGILSSIDHVNMADVQATLCELTAVSITRSIIDVMPYCEEVLVCGGGSKNDYLMTRLQANLDGCHVSDTCRLGVDPGHVEAMAFAWLARQTLLGRPGNLPSVTGARHAVTLGAIYSA